MSETFSLTALTHSIAHPSFFREVELCHNRYTLSASLPSDPPQRPLGWHWHASRNPCYSLHASGCCVLACCRVDIFAAYTRYNPLPDGYNYLSGTSMACPHVSMSG